MTEKNTEETAATAASPKKSPSLIAYKIRQAGEKSYWDRIGAAFVHKDGQGFDLDLEATPVDGRVTLRIPTEKPVEKEAA